MPVARTIPRKPTIFPFGIQGGGRPIVFDAAETIDHFRDTVFTDYPIASQGSGIRTVTDHAQKIPESVSLGLVVSAMVDSIVPNLVASRPRRMWRKLLRLWEVSAVFDLWTSAHVYTNVSLARVHLPQRVDRSLMFVIPVDIRKIELSGVDTDQEMADQAFEIAMAAEDIGSQALTWTSFAAQSVDVRTDLAARARARVS